MYSKIIQTICYFRNIFFILLFISSVLLGVSIGLAYRSKYIDESNTREYEKTKKNVYLGINVDFDRFGYTAETLVKKYNLKVDSQYFWTQKGQVELLNELYKLGFREFRINFKWKDLSTNGQVVDFNKIDEILAFFESKNDIRLNLCFGPYKNFSYPEQYVHERGIKLLSKKNINIIRENDKIYSLSKIYLNALLTKLKNEYPTIVKNTQLIQANNEPFHPFGTIPIKSSFEVEYKLIKLIEKYFPNRTITFNTPLAPLPKRVDQIFEPDIEDTKLFVEYLEKKDPQLLYKLTLGINYYSSIGEGLEKTPLSTIDSITTTQFFAFLTRRPTFEEYNSFLKKISSKYQKNGVGFNLKVAELQEETWNGQFTNEEPGKSVNISKKNITRLLSYRSKIINNGKINIDLWGAEQMALYSYLNRTLQDKPEEFIKNAQMNHAVVSYYVSQFNL